MYILEPSPLISISTVQGFAKGLLADLGVPLIIFLKA
jgi:hypothetical protein